jgi:hypothetical protein
MLERINNAQNLREKYSLRTAQHMTGSRECSYISIYYFLKLVTLGSSECKLHDEEMKSLQMCS